MNKENEISLLGELWEDPCWIWLEESIDKIVTGEATSLEETFSEDSSMKVSFKDGRIFVEMNSLGGYSIKYSWMFYEDQGTLGDFRLEEGGD